MTSAPWLNGALHRYVVIAAGITLVWIGYWAWQPPVHAWLEAVILAVTVAVLGLPHGALDFIAGRALLQPRLGHYWLVCFNGLYLGLCALVVLGWWWAPVPWMVVMLGLSALHFGSDDATPSLNRGLVRAVEVICRGTAVILLPLWLHTADATRIFAYLLPGTDPALINQWLTSASHWLVPPLLVGLLAVVWMHTRHWLTHTGHWRFHRDSVVEILSVCLVLTLLPPLLAFTLYFCAWHSMRQILLTSALLDTRAVAPALARFARRALLPTLSVLAVGVLIWRYGATEQHRVPLLVTLVFVTLFALTVPHMLLRAVTRRLSAE